jgi:hypothetical protein
VGALVLSVAAGWFAREKLLPGALMVIVKVVVPLAINDVLQTEPLSPAELGQALPVAGA